MSWGGRKIKYTAKPHSVIYEIKNEGLAEEELFHFKFSGIFIVEKHPEKGFVTTQFA